ncbi:MAG: hypothetical protein NVS2B9_11170 [Myxococcales bacterium]
MEEGKRRKSRGKDSQAHPRARWGTAAAALVFALFTLAQWTAVAGDAPEHRGAARFLAESWDPNPPPGSTPLAP